MLGYIGCIAPGLVLKDKNGDEGVTKSAVALMGDHADTLVLGHLHDELRYDHQRKLMTILVINNHGGGAIFILVP